jgi:hypothetical protein
MTPLTPTLDRIPAQTPVQRWAVRVATAIAFAVTWIFRWLTIDFANDHFVHLSRARQILLGELPVRDFFDPGLPLHYYASAAALTVSGQNLLGEAVLTVTLIALGAALTFYLAARSSRSLVLATVATVVAVAMFPRLYNYPKVFLYPLALVCLWHYATRRTTVALAALAGMTAIAALFRLDHGFYIGATAAVGLVLANRDRIRAIPAVAVRFAAMTAVLLLPFLIFIQLTAGIPAYAAGILRNSSTVARARILSLPIHIDRSMPWIAVDAPSPPRVSVRWQPDTSDDQRRQRETQLGLTDGIGDRGTTWSYVLADTRREAIEALVNDPSVADTHNIDRDALRVVASESWLQRARNRSALLRARIAPGVLTSANAMAWLYYATVFVPLAALLVLLIQWRRGTLAPFDTVTIGTAVVMCLLIHQGLIRESPDSRLPDVAGPTAVLAAWITGAMGHRQVVGKRGFRGQASAPASPRWKSVAVRAGASALWVGTLWAATTFGETGERISATGILAGPAATAARSKEVTRLVTLRPIDFYASPGSTGVRALTRYVLECTRPSDRVLTGSFEPQVFFYAERPFAGGQVYLRAGWHGSPEDQQLTIARMQRQRVPIVFFSTATEPEVQRGFPQVYRYVEEQYQLAMRSSFGGDRDYTVFVKRGVQPRSMYTALNLPCFR